MEDQLPLIIGFLALTAVVFFLAWRSNAKSKHALHAQYKRLASELDISIEWPPAALGGLFQANPVLHGRYKDHDISIFNKSYGLDNLRQTDTSIRILTHAPQAMHFVLSRRNLSGKLGQFGRHKEHLTGHAPFDAEFILRNKSETPMLTRFFSDEICEHIVTQMHSESGFFNLEDGVLSYIEFGLIETDAKREHIKKMLECMLELVAAFEIFRE